MVQQKILIYLLTLVLTGTISSLNLPKVTASNAFLWDSTFKTNNKDMFYKEKYIVTAIDRKTNRDSIKKTKPTAA